MQTFVVRVWTPATPDAAVDTAAGNLHGIVEHVGSGRLRPFSGGPDVIDFLVECVHEPAAPAPDRTVATGELG